MPTLNWIGKEAVVKHHKEVPFRLLESVPELSCGDADSGNLIVQGDNLHALKALLPRYAGQVKCIYIDPPYNTGNEGWIYNDNVNSPEIRKWLGEVVGKEGETLDRHDRWLCMMYPRLVLLRQFLREDGAIFVSIDDNEVATLRFLMDEIFGAKNFVATVLWQKVYSPKNSARHLSEDHDYIVIYAAKADAWKPNLLPRTEEQNAAYKNPDKDPRGVWKTSDLSARIRDLRKQAVRKAFQQALLGDDAASRVAVTEQYAFEFHAQAYAPSRDYDGRFGRFDFRKHFYGRIGDCDSKEEFECACWLDIQAQQGRIQFWVRNLVRREGSSFFLQKADGRFYPDFLCQLPGKDNESGPILAVEYKGADRWSGAEDDRLIGGLWASLSGGRCRFVMVKDKRWEWIEEKLSPSPARQS